MLELQYHVCDELVDKYVVRTGFNRSFKACAFQHCNHFLFVLILDLLLCVFYLFVFLA